VASSIRAKTNTAVIYTYLSYDLASERHANVSQPRFTSAVRVGRDVNGAYYSGGQIAEKRDGECPGEKRRRAG